MRASRMLAPAAVLLALVVPSAAVARSDPGPVTHLVVSGKATSRVRHVTWDAPVSAVPVSSYRVTIKHGHAVYVAFAVTSPSATLRRRDFHSGRYKLIVVATSKDGSGPKVSRHFSVHKPAH